MGSQQAQGYAQGAADGFWDLDQALEAHLTSNHYPPLPAGYVPLAKQAIEHANSGDLYARIAIPSDLDPKPRVMEDGAVSAVHLVEILHLHAFLDDEDEE